MELFDSVLLFLLAGLVAVTVIAHRAGNERRDVRLLMGLSALCGAGAAAALAWQRRPMRTRRLLRCRFRRRVNSYRLSPT